MSALNFTQKDEQTDMSSVFASIIEAHDPTFKFMADPGRHYGDPTNIDVYGICRAIVEQKDESAMKISLIVGTTSHQVSFRKETVPVLQEMGGSSLNHSSGSAVILADADGSLVNGHQVCHVGHFGTRPNFKHAIIHAAPGTLVAFGICDGHSRRMVCIYRIDGIVTGSDKTLAELTKKNKSRNRQSKNLMAINLSLVAVRDYVHNETPTGLDIPDTSGNPFNTKQLVDLILQKLSGESYAPIGVEFFYSPGFVHRNRESNYLLNADYGEDVIDVESNDFFETLAGRLSDYRSKSNAKDRFRLNGTIPMQHCIGYDKTSHELILSVTFNQVFPKNLPKKGEEQLPPEFDQAITVRTILDKNGPLPWQLVRDKALLAGFTDYDALERYVIDNGVPFKNDDNLIVLYSKLDSHA